jgi:hypothetical protein
MNDRPSGDTSLACHSQLKNSSSKWCSTRNLSSSSSSSSSSSTMSETTAPAPPVRDYRDTARDIIVESLYSNLAPKAASAAHSKALECTAALLGMDVETFLRESAKLEPDGEINDLAYGEGSGLYAELIAEAGRQPVEAGKVLVFDQVTKRARVTRHLYAMWRSHPPAGSEQRASLDNINLQEMWDSVIRECRGKNAGQAFKGYLWWKKALHYPSNTDWRCHPPDRSILGTFSAYYKWWNKLTKMGDVARTAALTAAAAADVVVQGADNPVCQGETAAPPGGAGEQRRPRSASGTLDEERGNGRTSAAGPAMAVAGVRAPHGVRQEHAQDGGIGTGRTRRSRRSGTVGDRREDGMEMNECPVAAVGGGERAPVQARQACLEEGGVGNLSPTNAGRHQTRFPPPTRRVAAQGRIPNRAREASPSTSSSSERHSSTDDDESDDDDDDDDGVSVVENENDTGDGIGVEVRSDSGKESDEDGGNGENDGGEASVADENLSSNSSCSTTNRDRGEGRTRSKAIPRQKVAQGSASRGPSQKRRAQSIADQASDRRTSQRRNVDNLNLQGGAVVPSDGAMLARREAGEDDDNGVDGDIDDGGPVPFDDLSFGGTASAGPRADESVETSADEAMEASRLSVPPAPSPRAVGAEQQRLSKRQRVESADTGGILETSGVVDARSGSGNEPETSNAKPNGGHEMRYRPTGAGSVEAMSNEDDDVDVDDDEEFFDAENGDDDSERNAPPSAGPSPSHMPPAAGRGEVSLAEAADVDSGRRRSVGGTKPTVGRTASFRYSPPLACREPYAAAGGFARQLRVYEWRTVDVPRGKWNRAGGAASPSQCTVAERRPTTPRGLGGRARGARGC